MVEMASMDKYRQTPFARSRPASGNAASQVRQVDGSANNHRAESRLGRDFGQMPLHVNSAKRRPSDSKASAFAARAEPVPAPTIALKSFNIGVPQQHGASQYSPDKSMDERSQMQDQSASKKVFAATADGVHMEAEATGVYSSADFPNGFKWTQTIDTNFPLGGAGSPYVDPRPNDDTKPFYWTDAEHAANPTTFIDFPSRPTPATGTTRWDATLCLNGVNEATKTVTACDALTYGFSRDSTGAITTRAPRSSGSRGHQGILSREFADWTFKLSGLSGGAKAALGALGGAAVGAGIGALAGGGVGTLVGAGIGALVGGIGSLLF
jgi:hypothetical protein